jgi:hypothetical protein
MSDADLGIRTALQSRLDGAAFFASGPLTNVSCVPGGYVRAAGSFASDGWKAGDTVLASGFALAANNGLSRVTAVSASQLSVVRTLTAAAAGPSVTLTATIPAARKWDGQPFTEPAPTEPWIRATLQHAGSPLVAYGAGGLVRSVGVFAIDLFVPQDAGRGLAVVERLAGQLRTLFKPGTRVDPSGLDVRVTQFRRSQVFDDPSRLQLPIGVEYLCNIPNA